MIAALQHDAALCDHAMHSNMLCATARCHRIEVRLCYITLRGSTMCRNVHRIITLHNLVAASQHCVVLCDVAMGCVVWRIIVLYHMIAALQPDAALCDHAMYSTVLRATARCHRIAVRLCYITQRGRTIFRNVQRVITLHCNRRVGVLLCVRWCVDVRRCASLRIR